MYIYICIYIYSHTNESHAEFYQNHNKYAALCYFKHARSITDFPKLGQRIKKATIRKCVSTRHSLFKISISNLLFFIFNPVFTILQRK